MTQVYNSPPNWPLPPPNWQPPSDWEPDPAWGPAPYGWQFWSADPATTPGTGRDKPQYVPGQALTRAPSAQLAASTTGRPPPVVLAIAVKVTISVVGGFVISVISGALTLTRWLIATGLICTGFLVRAALRWKA